VDYDREMDDGYVAFALAEAVGVYLSSIGRHSPACALSSRAGDCYVVSAPRSTHLTFSDAMMAGMSEKSVHVWRMIHAETPNFAASDILVACLTPDEAEARTRAGWNAMSPKGEVSAEYLGEMSMPEYDSRRAKHVPSGGER
jgi:hypothetical protein